MSKLATFLYLLICFGLTYASRPNVEFDAIISPHRDVSAYKTALAVLDDESCEGIDGSEECLMRRTLVAHVDYIYTQKHKP
ncbi:hypothetical protein AAZX31_06G044600 [Glycine max]|uniref:Phytosulfokine n=2 Tax=Glycine subgen. Soja TaxID=1462606 RepID=K7KT52_SOYBN|nr:hypothetical protein JHK85_014762 [Glycine max]KHN45129.1 Phytosulfokines 3 [Glycine soja]KAG5045008.1 hypothetical protein JHK86_014414 [Glycine max]KAG5147505.1 hypothetical protein JHK82_014386 [Glycine max]KAH1124204.1 hypothetical protein GYH30_014099 [Glycine max]